MLPVNFSKMGIFRTSFCILDENFPTEKKIFRQFSDSPEFRGGDKLPPASSSHDATGECITGVFVAAVGTVCLLDIAFVVDYSGSIRDTNEGGVDNWQFVIDFMVNVVRSVNVAPDRTHVAAVSFGMFLYDDRAWAPTKAPPCHISRLFV